MVTPNTDRSVEELKAEIEDLESAIDLHREMLKDLTASESSEITSLLYESKKLESNIITTIETQIAINGRILINEQIYTECSIKQSEISNEYKEQMNDISDQISRKERVLKQLSLKNTGLKRQEKNSITEKTLIIIPPSLSIINQHIQIEKYRAKMQKKARKLYIVQDVRDLLIKVCSEIWKGCFKIHVLLKNPLNRKQGTDKNTLVSLAMPKKDFNFEFRFDDETDSEDEFLSSQFPEKNKVKSTCTINIPSLDFSKLKKSSVHYPVAMQNDHEHNIEERCDQVYEVVKALKKDLFELSEVLIQVKKKNEELLKRNEELAGLHLGYAITKQFYK